MVRNLEKIKYAVAVCVLIFGSFGLVVYVRLMTWVQPVTRYSYTMMTCRQVRCDVLTDGFNGRWEKSFVDGSPPYTNQYLKSDQETRQRMGLPSTLFHPEFKCGPRAPIAGTNLPSECDPASRFPCCNEGTGWCGATALHCSHVASVNYGILMQRHDVEWVPPLDRCILANINHEEACLIMRAKPGHIVFIGDSQAQQFFLAFMLWLTHDFEYGVIGTEHLEFAKKKGCHREFQLTDPKCRKLTYNSSDAISNMCDGNLKAEYVYDYEKFLSKRVQAKVESLVGKAGSYIIFGNGLHYDANHQTYTKFFLEPLVGILQAKKAKWPKVFIETLPGIPSRALGTQRLEFRNVVTSFCQGKPLTIFDNFPLTAMLRSYDGKHYGLKHNLLKVKLFLNYLSNVCSSS